MGNLVGYTVSLGVTYPLCYTSFNKSSRMWLLLNPDISSNSVLMGRRVGGEDIIEMLDIGQSLQIGTPLRLNKILQELAELKLKLVVHTQPVIVGSVSQYKDDNGNVMHVQGRDYVYVYYKSKNGTIIVLETAQAFSTRKNQVLARAEKIIIDQSKVHTSMFLDSTMESLELRGYNFDWLECKSYIPLHTMEDVKTLFLPHLKRCLKETKEKSERLLVELDFESKGLNAYDDNYIGVDNATFLGVSFEDDTAYGFFLEMEHFANLPKDEIAEFMTQLFSNDLIVDRDVLVDGETFKRSDFMTASHNIMIDIRFGLTVGMDIWFNVCSMQLGFNLDPFMTKGHNGAKDRVEQFFGIIYPDLGETAGKGFYGYFNRFSDKRVVMMYGSADVDLVRMYTRDMLIEIPKLKEYFGVDQVKQFHELDEVYLNMKARFDFKGIRIDREEAQKRASIAESKINTIKSFLSYYVPREKMSLQYMAILKHMVETNKDPKNIKSPPNLDDVPPMNVDKWSGEFLIKVLSRYLGYPLLEWGKSSKSQNVKPKMDKEAVVNYLRHKADIIYPEKIASLDDYRVVSKYLKEDIMYDTLDKDGNREVAISAKIFNTFQYPVFYVLSILGPLENELSSDFRPILETESLYRHTDTRSTTIVTRRDVSPLSTVKGSNKDLYIAHDPNNYYFVGADQAAVEIRVSAGLSEDNKIIDPLKDPECDPHIETASQMLNKPPYLIDKKKERGPIKFVNFGRIYLRGAYSICKQIHGVVTDESRAQIERLLVLFDRDKASIHKELNMYRARSILPQDTPEWLAWFLKMKEGVSYGKMDNTFGFCQHIDLTREERWWIPQMQRKSGNFAVQGLAANLLRVLYTRFVKECWARGWVQDDRIIIHNTVYDEIIFSAHNSLDPFEVISVLRESFVVKYKKLPPLYLGVNITRTWGDTKDDKYEIPHVLLKEYVTKYKNGDTPKLPEDTDYVSYFLDDIVAFKIRRTVEELDKKLFDKSKVLNFEQFSSVFQSYYVRSLLLEFKCNLFKIHDFNDPVEVLASTLLYFLSKHVLVDGDVLKVRLRGVSFGITNKTHLLKFDSEKDLVQGIKSKVTETLSSDIDTFEEEDEDDRFYTFEDLGDDEYTYSPNDITQWVLPGEYDPSSLLVKEVALPSFKNFSVRDSNLLLKFTEPNKLRILDNILLGNVSTSLDSVNIFVKSKFSSKNLNRYTYDILTIIDNEESLWT